MILPAGIARFWSRDITGMIAIAAALACCGLCSAWCCRFNAGLPSGPPIILVAAALYAARRLLFGPVGGLSGRCFRGRHLEA